MGKLFEKLTKIFKQSGELAGKNISFVENKIKYNLEKGVVKLHEINHKLYEVNEGMYDIDASKSFIDIEAEFEMLQNKRYEMYLNRDTETFKLIDAKHNELRQEYGLCDEHGNMLEEYTNVEKTPEYIKVYSDLKESFNAKYFSEARREELIKEAMSGQIPELKAKMEHDRTERLIRIAEELKEFRASVLSEKEAEMSAYLDASEVAMSLEAVAKSKKEEHESKYEDIFAQMNSGIAETRESIVNSKNEIKEMALNSIDVFADNVGDKMSGAAQRVSTVKKAAVAKGVDAVLKTSGRVDAFADNVGQKLGDKMQEFGDAASDFGTTVKNDAKRNLIEARREFKDGYGKLKGEFGNLYEKGESRAKDLVKSAGVFLGAAKSKFKNKVHESVYGYVPFVETATNVFGDTVVRTAKGSQVTYEYRDRHGNSFTRKGDVYLNDGEFVEDDEYTIRGMEGTAIDHIGMSKLDNHLEMERVSGVISDILSAESIEKDDDIIFNRNSNTSSERFVALLKDGRSTEFSVLRKIIQDEKGILDVKRFAIDFVKNGVECRIENEADVQAVWDAIDNQKVLDKQQIQAEAEEGLGK